MNHRKFAGAAELRPGWAIVVEVTSQGGIHYEPAIIGKDENTRIVTHVQTVDDEGLDKRVTQTRNAVLNAVRKYATHTDIGVWYGDSQALEFIEAEMEGFRKKIVQINQHSRDIGSKRRTRCEYFTFPWPHDEPKLRLRMGNMIYQRLAALKDMYLDKRKDRYRVEMDKCKNLDKLAREPQASLVRNAINVTEQQRPLMIRNYGGSNIPLELRRLAVKELKFDYGPVDAALKEFEPAANLFLTELRDFKALTSIPNRG